MSFYKLIIAGLLIIISFLSYLILSYLLVKPDNRQPEQQSQQQSEEQIEQQQAGFFAIYDMDLYTEEPVIDYYVKIPGDASLKARVQMLADKLSKLKFSNLPINLVNIEEVQGKKTAVIDLRSKAENKKTWKSHYFQGSAGGKQTETRLIKTFLQGEYDGPWVDGVEFLYNGEDISREHWDHIPKLSNRNF